MKAYRGKLPLSIIITITLCGFAFVALLYTDIIKYTTTLEFKSCPNKNVLTKSKENSVETNMENTYLLDDRFDFDPEECDVAHGKWVYNKSIKPLYTDRSCPYLDTHVSCVKNGRPDTRYQHWEWQPDDCTLPKFNLKTTLQKPRGKKLMFVGDSLQKGQWESFVCMVESIIPEDRKSLRRGRFHSVFTAKEYNATIEFYWAPYLVESNSDNPIIADPKKRILKVDSVAKHAQHWLDKDILVFNTYVWWMSSLRIKALWDSFGNEELDMLDGYKIGLKTWANWVDANIYPNKTRLFFTTMSPTHTRSEDWGRINGTQCFNETRPITKREFWSTGANKQMMSVVASVVAKMKVPVTFINITQLSDYRIDSHSSIYTETGGNMSKEERRTDPQHHADCIHWCLPGVPDTWNKIFFAYL